MWDATVSALVKSPRRFERRAHRQSINARMTASVYDTLNRSRKFRAALAAYLASGSDRPDDDLAFARRWNLSPANAVRDLHWTRREFERGVNPHKRLRVGTRPYPGLTVREVADPAACAAKGYELTPPALASARKRRTSAQYLMAHRHGVSYQTIATLAQRSVATVHGVVRLWNERLYPRPS